MREETEREAAMGGGVEDLGPGKETANPVPLHLHYFIDVVRGKLIGVRWERTERDEQKQRLF